MKKDGIGKKNYLCWKYPAGAKLSGPKQGTNLGDNDLGKPDLISNVNNLLQHFISAYEGANEKKHRVLKMDEL